MDPNITAIGDKEKETALDAKNGQTGANMKAFMSTGRRKAMANSSGLMVAYIRVNSTITACTERARYCTQIKVHTMVNGNQENEMDLAISNGRTDVSTRVNTKMIINMDLVNLHLATGMSMRGTGEGTSRTGKAP